MLVWGKTGSWKIHALKPVELRNVHPLIYTVGLLEKDVMFGFNILMILKKIRPFISFVCFC